ncbi:nuclear transport factor 2 family protein [Roseivirga sp. E12]|uniref:nuclear transport factor 2 family protein n=1 Tax=Roseivirga sp. E12 TaxID=2819237 RepID=UPI001ABC5E92|nr:nuclear transport factor 2 family protein [Roseivirga sp. E12]MBO3697728.1 nuclear transport factor 2 family protein [Roseivirga sp. E12]
MRNKLFFSLILFIASVQITTAITLNDFPFDQTQKDSVRMAEIDRFWERLNQSVIEGDFEAYKKCFHKDAVIVFASGEYKTSVPIAVALKGWEQGFKDVKEGKTKVNVEFRFSQRMGDETTAYETGMFIYTSTDNASKATNKFIIPFDMLLVKRNNQWYGMMEVQKPLATQEEWDALG